MKVVNLDLTKMPGSILVKPNIRLVGKYIGKGSSVLKTASVFNFKASQSISRIDIRAVLYDQSSFDFDGILRIEKGAIETDTYLSVKCLLIGKESKAKVVPSLEILESSVKAGHGATIGYLNPVELFYLESRGLSRDKAQSLLINAFLKF